MRKMFALFFIILMSGPLYESNAQNAVDHLNQLTESFDGLRRDTWRYLKSITHGKSARKVEKRREKLIEEYENQKQYVESIPAFENDDTLKNAVIDFLELYATVLREDYAEIMDMEEIAEQSYDLMEAYILAQEKAWDKLDNAYELLREKQEHYAYKNNITLLEAEKDKMGEKIENASLALKYYNHIYLIFFKVYKQELYVFEAIENQDVSGIEQNSNALLQMSDEALAQLKQQEPYKGDGSLVFAAEKLMGFYKDEAEKDFPSLIDFYIKKDNMDKIAAIVEKKSKRKRTQEDIDKYNKAAEEFNKAVAVYNKTLESGNDDRSRYFELWNDRTEAFFERHSR